MYKRICERILKLCVRMLNAHAYGYAGTYAQARIPKTRKERFSTLKLGLE